MRERCVASSGPASRGPAGKIIGLRATARKDDGLAAECVLALLARRPVESDEQQARIYTGALLIVDAISELRNIRRLLTASG